MASPQCAIAHLRSCFSASANVHQLWDFPEAGKLEEGHKEVAAANKLRPQGPREKGLVAAAAFYQKSYKLSHLQRKQAYCAALKKLRREVPGDVEIDAFYALSLVSLAEETPVDSRANLEQAIAVLQPLFQQYPDHPGVAHYLIHAPDNPELAEQGLAAARRYAAIAPASPHALHMPSHIFVRLGLWQDSIASNIASNASAARAAEMHTVESHYQTHAMDFLSFSYLQSGQESKAREVIAHADHIVGAGEESQAHDRAYLAARTALELHRWKEAASLTAPGVSKNHQSMTQWARAIGAARSADAAAAQSAVKELTKSVEERDRRARKSGYDVATEKATDLAEAEARVCASENGSGAAGTACRGRSSG